jgi:hypothetical protein
MPSKKKPTKKRLQRVSIRAERRPEPDWDKFAWALIQHVRIQQAAKRAKGAKP